MTCKQFYLIIVKLYAISNSCPLIHSTTWKEDVIIIYLNLEGHVRNLMPFLFYAEYSKLNPTHGSEQKKASSRIRQTE